MLKNITLSAQEEIITLARKRASSENSTLNQVFRTWLSSYAKLSDKEISLHEYMRKFNYAKPGRSFSRSEMNER